MHSIYFEDRTGLTIERDGHSFRRPECFRRCDMSIGARRFRDRFGACGARGGHTVHARGLLVDRLR
jgi:hypothetical protein